jgi:inner membrane protein
MQKTLLYKIIIVVILTAVITIPLAMIQSTINERKQFHDDAVRSIAADSVREQSVTGPLLVIPYTDEYQEREDTTEDGKKKVIYTPRTIQRILVVYPNELNVTGTIDTDQRYRGIHKVLVYTGQHAISGDFILPHDDAFVREKKDSKLTLGQAYMAIGIDDVRGIHQIPGLDWGGRKSEFRQGSGLAALPSGLNAPVGPLDLDSKEPVKFSFALKLDGIERLGFTPVGKNNHVTLSSKWPHPQFGGRFLPPPHNRTINSNGFTATWDISSLATNAQQQLTDLIGQTHKNEAGAASLAAVDSFSVGFIEPINIYSQADRAVKYGLLFVALTFAAFFLFEVLKQLPIHPVQYALVGLALTLFFLLLVSLSEQIPFAAAYVIASAACILLNGFYLAHVLRNRKRGFGFGAALTLLYGVLYGVLQSENNALLMGSILLFGVLSAIMIATRKVDWYRIGKTMSAGGSVSSASAEPA